MKKNIFLRFAAMYAMLIWCGNLYAQKQCYIKGYINGITAGTAKLGAYHEEDRTTTEVDSSAIVSGSFKLTVKTVPQMMSITIEPGNWSFNVFTDGAVITISADTAGSSHYDYSKYGAGKGALITKFTETGSKNYEDWMAYQNDPGQKQYDKVFAGLNKKFTAAGKDIDAQYKVRDQIDSVEKLEQAWQKKKIDAYVAQNPSSVAGIYMFDQLYRFISGSMSYPDLTAMLDKFTGEAKESVYYSYLLKEKMKLAAVQPGVVAPDFTLLKRDSTKFTLSSVTKGQYTMIDFWASWCHPCRQAIPHWKTIYQKYHDKGFDIISVSDDNKWKNWITAMDQEKMPWTQVDDTFPKKNMPAEVGSLYMTTSIPFYVLLDKEGKILVYTNDETKIDEKLKEIYHE
jgi:thiol-disulfide isomerase/thioredoxin